MKRLGSIIALVLGLAALLIVPSSAGVVGSSGALGVAESAWAVPMADQARSFDVTFDVAQDGSVKVTERISWEFPAGQARRGIERLVTTRAGYRDSEDVYRLYRISDVSASSPSGAPDEVHIADLGATTRIRVGDPNQTVSGVQDYIVSYRLDKIVNDIGDGTAEFYYNLIATSNTNTYQGISASVTAPAAATKSACYYGAFGATDECTHTPGTTATFSAPDVTSGQGVTIITSYPRDAFGDLTPDLIEYTDSGYQRQELSPTAAKALSGILVGTGVLLPVGAAALLGTLVYTRGRDEWYAGLTPGLTPGPGEEVPTRRGSLSQVVVQFHPPEGVQPGLVGVIQDESADVLDVSATIVDLAVRGFLRIEEIKGGGLFGRDDWLLTWLQPPSDAKPLTAYENTIIDGIFKQGTPVKLSDLKNKFASTLGVARQEMYSETVDRGWFRRSPDAMRSTWTGLGMFVTAAGAVLGFLAMSGFGDLFLGGGLSPVPLFVFIGGLMLSGLIIVSLGRRMAARTADGSAVLAQSMGFRRYMETAEANQIKWEEAEDIFSRFLPYAIVFGIADKWAKTFEEVAQAAAAAGHVVVLPNWYVGTGSFGNLASSMDSFSTVAAGTLVSTPGSSGGSGFSSGGGGFGGGGFSGGGGGGASGGSW